MSSIPRFEINGVVDTSKTVMSNLNDLCNACGSWLTFDSNTGLWSVVINKPGSSVKSFTDKNIIGSINVSGSGIAELYNGVSIQFPNKDLRDQTDFVEYSIPEDQRFPNEYDNTLEMSLKYTTDPIQASYLGRVELKQSRFDKIIEFATDYTGLGLKAGDIIDVTATMYGFNQKLFRVTKAQEADTDDGGIQISITALEYDPSVYNEDGLLRIERNKKTGIVPKSMNTALSESDAKAAVNTLTIGLDTADKEAIQKLSELLVKNGGFQQNVKSFSVPFVQLIGDGQMHSLGFGISVALPSDGKYKVRYNVAWGSRNSIDIGFPSVSPPLGQYMTNLMQLKLNGVDLNVDDPSSNAVQGDLYFPTYHISVIEATINALKNQTLEFGITYATDYPNVATPPGYPTVTPYPGDYAYFAILGEVFLIG